MAAQSAASGLLPGYSPLRVRSFASASSKTSKNVQSAADRDLGPTIRNTPTAATPASSGQVSLVRRSSTHASSRPNITPPKVLGWP